MERTFLFVSGHLLRRLADLAWAGDQKDLSTKLHELAREVEAEEDKSRCAA